jgi:hypothetical protein
MTIIENANRDIKYREMKQGDLHSRTELRHANIESSIASRHRNNLGALENFHFGTHQRHSIQ